VDDCWETMDSYRFWKLVWYLPHYEGATRNMLKILADQREQQPVYNKRVTTDEDGNREIPAEMVNATLGSNLISFGQG